MLVVTLGSLRVKVKGSCKEEELGASLTPCKEADPQALQDGMVGERGGWRAV